MRRITCLSVLIVFAFVTSGSAQQVWVTTPLVNVSDSFFENFGINWGFNFGRPGPRGGAFFNMGNRSTPPPFGGYDPSADATFGFRAGPFSFNLRAGQGSQRSIVTQAPSIMLPNGGSGFIASGTVRPFVTGIEPVVNGIMSGRFVPRVSGLAERWKRYQYLKKYEPWKLEDPPEPVKAQPAEKLDSRIGKEDAPLFLIGEKTDKPKETKRQPQKQNSTSARSSTAKPSVLTAKQAGMELQRLINRGRSLETRGKFFYARLYYEQAERKAQSPQLKNLLRGRIQAMLERNEG